MVSKLVVSCLEPHFANHPLFPRDSKTAISRIEHHPIASSDTLFSLDVVSLYPSMDVPDVLAAMVELCEIFKLPHWFIHAVDFVLNNTLFVFEDVVYHQRQGMAMGTNMAVLIAIAYLFVRLERSHLVAGFIASGMLSLYQRYVDDIIGVWTDTFANLKSWIEQLQILIPGIKFTLEVESDGSLDFLDLNLFRSSSSPTANSRLLVRCHQKSINTYSYITARSHHPAALKRGFIRGELIRYVRNSSRLKDFEDLRARFWARLRNRGYSMRFLSEPFMNVLYSDRQSFLEPKIRSGSKIIPFVVRHHSCVSTLGIGRELSSIRFNNLLGSWDEACRPTFLLSLRSNRSLGRILRARSKYRGIRVPRVQG